ncbi:MAG: sigma-70 family RNA polymerase sigma factor [Ruminococcus sp.]|nr:sigma-70 family RNA polymerase sigma factor [Ruminococcus sp.]
MKDSEVIALLFERSEQAIDALRACYGRLVRRVAEGITHSCEDAEEIENDTYLAMWESIPPERPDPLGAYICAAARNLSLKKCREKYAAKRSAELTVPLEELDEFIGSDELSERISARELGEAINRFLDGLDPGSRALFVRRYYLSQSVAESAEAVGISENNAFVKLSRLRRKLKKQLEKEGYVL